MSIIEALPLSQKQVRSIAESTDPNATIMCWSGAIRSGKTIASLLRWLMYVANAPEGGQLVMAGKTAMTVSRNLFAPLKDASIFGPLANEVHYTSGAPTATILGKPFI